MLTLTTATRKQTWNAFLCAAAVLALINVSNAQLVGGSDESLRPAVGKKVQDFELANLNGQKIKLSDKLKDGPVVLIVLRGYPGYQCPACGRQAGQFISAAKKLQAANATVLMVYPGPSENLQKRAEEFITGKTLPENVHLLIDPDYTFTNAYGLRWNADRETAYPSTFVVDTNGKVRFAKISMTHGDRASAKEVLNVLSK